MPRTLLILLCYLSLSLGDIIPYHNHLVYPGKPEYLIIPKFAKNDVPNWSPGHGHSYIDLSQITLQIDCSVSSFSDCGSGSNEKSVTFELLMFQMPTDKSFSSYWPDDAYCCNSEEIEEDQLVDSSIH
jgi:hypothetical protein